MTQTLFEYGTQRFEFGNHVSDPTVTCSFSSESSTMSCPSSAASSRRSSEISYANSSSFSCFTPGSPGSPGSPPNSTIAFAEMQQINPLIGFSSSKLPPCGKEGVSMELFNRLGHYIPPSAMSFDSVNISGDDIPHEYSVSSTQCFQAHLAEARALEVLYPNDIGTVLPDETTQMAYLRLSPPLMVPSQMPMHLNSQADPNPDNSLTESPEVAQESVIDSYYQSEGTVVAVSYRPSNTHMTSTRRNRCLQKFYPGSRNHPGNTKMLERSRGSSRFRVRALKPECTRATATISKKYKCLLCEKGFDRQEHYNRHLISKSHQDTLPESGKETPEPPKVYSCLACGRQFNRKDNLKPHIKTHLLEEGKNHRGKAKILVTIEQSIRYGWAQLDPRIPDGGEAGRNEKKTKG